MSRPTALVLANGLFDTSFAKTAHGLVRGPCRYRPVAVIDPDHAGRDAGEVLDGRRRDLPIHPSVETALAALPERPDVCVVGVATVGGVLPEPLYEDLKTAARAGMTLVSGLHRLLSDDPELARLARENGGEIIDVRRPKKSAEMTFWSGEILNLEVPRVAVLGTDCALGKRTTAVLLQTACRNAGIRTEMIYTGQTGWLQGYPYGFIFDATINDFLGGEIEQAILRCAREAEPDLILIEGQSSLRNPSGPCGSEFILCADVAGVIMQHAPGRRHYIDFEDTGREIAPIAEEIELVRLLGSEVWAVTLNHEGLERAELDRVRDRLEDELGLPVLDPLWHGTARLVEVVAKRLGLEVRA